MKKILNVFMILSLAVLLVSCGDKEQGRGDPELKIVPDKDILFDKDGGSEKVTVETNLSSWSAKSDQTWCAVTEAEGYFTVSAQLNTLVEAMPEAIVTVTAREGSEEVTRTLKVNQTGTGMEDLSRAGVANSYIVSSAGTYSFNATVIGNGDAGIVDGGFHAASSLIAPASAGLLWQDYYQDGKGLIASAALNGDKTKVVFTTSELFVPGNAVIAVYDDGGDILWSWHIWMPQQEVQGLNSAMGYSVMSMNLGATVNEVADPKSYGMLYQWGRKDPLPAAATLTGNTTTVGVPVYDMEGKEVKITNSSWTDSTSNTLVYSIQNPTICLSSYSYYAASRDWLAPGQSNDALWGNPEGHLKDDENKFINKGKKSIYDPCPAGWRVPPADVFQNFTSSGGYAWADSEGNVPDFNIYDKNGDGKKSIDDYEYGWIFNLNEGVTSYFPAAARFDGSYAMLMGSMSGLWGSYWGNCIFESSYVPFGAYGVLSFQVMNQQGATAISLSPGGGAGRADAYSVRCIKE